MPRRYIKLKSNLRAENVPCSKTYFKKYFEGKSFEVVEENRLVVRVQDETGEEWCFMKVDILVDTTKTILA